MRHRITIVSALMFLCCNTLWASSPSEADLWALGRKKFGNDRFALLTLPGSTGPVNEALVSGWSALLGPSALVRHTASRLKEIHSRNLDVVVSGTSPTKTKGVLLRALATLRPGSLSGMRIHVVGIEAQEVQQASQRVGANVVR